MPLLRGISDFYVSYAVPSNSSVFGPFGVRHGATGDEISLPFTCSQEVCHGGAAGAEHNAMQDLAYARMVWTKLLQYTDSDPTLGGERPAAATKAERAVWANSLRRLAPFQTVTAVVPGQPNRVSAAAPFDVCVFLRSLLKRGDCTDHLRGVGADAAQLVDERGPRVVLLARQCRLSDHTL